jgi:hypothetical protein
VHNTILNVSTTAIANSRNDHGGVVSSLAEIHHHHHHHHNHHQLWSDGRSGSSDTCDESFFLFLLLVYVPRALCLPFCVGSLQQSAVRTLIQTRHRTGEHSEGRLCGSGQFFECGCVILMRRTILWLNQMQSIYTSITQCLFFIRQGQPGASIFSSGALRFSSRLAYISVPVRASCVCPLSVCLVATLVSVILFPKQCSAVVLGVCCTQCCIRLELSCNIVHILIPADWFIWIKRSVMLYRFILSFKTQYSFVTRTQTFRHCESLTYVQKGRSSKCVCVVTRYSSLVCLGIVVRKQQKNILWRHLWGHPPYVQD